MAKMKTLTVSGQTYTVNDPEAVSFVSQMLTAGQQQTARDNIGACTEKSIQDQLCPSFTESGAIVQCEPVAGYPLEVAWETKNLCPVNESYTFTGVVTKRFSAPLPAGTYTWSCGGYEAGGDSCPNFVVFDENDTAIPGCGFMVNEQTKTFTTSHTICGVYAYSNGWAVESKEVTGTVTQLQLEKGTTATAYEPYAETATITRCGKNLFGGSAMASKMAAIGGTKNEDDNSVYVPGANLAGKVVFTKFKENTRYTFVFDAKTKSASSSLSIQVKYSDGTRNAFFVENSTERQRYVYVSDAGKTIKQLEGIYYSDTTFYCDTCGIFEGNISVEEFEPYNGGTFAPGEAIPAIPGVNTVYADTGLATVTGKADPVVIIEKLTNAIIAMGGNI